MKKRTDFVSNSSSSSFIVPIDKVNHDKTKWMKNTLNVQPDNKRVMMKFDDFSYGEVRILNSVEDNWKFVCSQVLHWICYDLCIGESRESVKKITRKIKNDPEFIALDNAVKNYLPDCEGIEFDEEDLRVHKLEDDDYYVSLVPECSLDHDSVYNGFDDLLKSSGCSSIAELIWGVKEIRIVW